MAISEPVSCEICLRPYPRSHLLHVAVGSDIQGQGRLATVCGSCAGEIADALAATRGGEREVKPNAP